MGTLECVRSISGGKPVKCHEKLKARCAMNHKDQTEFSYLNQNAMRDSKTLLSWAHLNGEKQALYYSINNMNGITYDGREGFDWTHLNPI